MMTSNITFTLPEEALEGASEAILLGDFNNWNPEGAPKLEKQQDGSYSVVVILEVGQTYQYRLLLNDGRWVNDYHAQSYSLVPGFYIDNCVITVPEPVAEINKPTVEKAAKKVVAKSKAATKAKNAETAKPASKKATKKVSAKTPASKSAKPKPAAKKVESKKVDTPSKSAKKAAQEATK